MEAFDKIKKALIGIQNKNPFFSYLSLYLKFNENNDMPMKTMCIDSKGNIQYDKEFVDNLSSDEVKGVVIHEILHLALLHMTRENGRNPKLFNIACDICVNNIISENNYMLPSGCIMPRHNEVTLFENQEPITIKKCNEKVAEEIYEELKAHIKKNKDKFKQKGNSKGGGSGGDGLGDIDLEDEQFDEHKQAKKGTPKEQAQAKEDEEFWSNKTHEASTMAKMRGELPEGMGRVLGKLHKETINWRAVLQKYITNSLPFNQTYSRPSKKSVSTGYYMPDITKEKIEVTIVLDLSGSVGEKELADFMSEVLGIGKSYENRITMRVLTHDTECYDCGIVANGNTEKLKKLELKGGGGTTFQCVVDYIDKNHPQTKAVVWITDGYAEQIKKPKYDILWVLSEGGSDEVLKSVGKVLKLGSSE